MAMEIESKFAGRRKAFLAQRYPKVYAGMEKTGELKEHLEEIGRQAKEVMDRTIAHYQPQIEAIQDKEAREVREGQVWLMAQEIALQEIVLTL